jgi:UDP:flavonoid glycosyltransferase YjiC (YdhE family)
MRILFSCTAGDGHFAPVVPLATAFADAEHQVVFATAASCTERVAAAGFGNLPAGPGVEEIADQMAAFRIRIQVVPPHERRPETFAYRFATLDAPAKLDALLSAATAWQPDLIVHETADLAAPPVAAALGVPSAQHSFGRLLPHACLERAAPLTAPLWEHLGLEPDPFSGEYRGPYIDICPPSFQDASPPDDTPVLHLRPTTRGAGDPLWRERLTGERPVVYVTLGTVFNDAARFSTILIGLADIDATVLATIGRNNDPAELGQLPENVTVERYVPQANVLPLCDVAVGHGGSGSTLGALAHGLPMLLLPHAADQFENAQACAALGAARVLMPDELTEEAVASAVSALLEESGARAAAERLAQEIAAMPTPAEVAAALL